jgi:hypothetical protein
MTFHSNSSKLLAIYSFLIRVMYYEDNEMSKGRYFILESDEVCYHLTIIKNTPFGLVPQIIFVTFRIDIAHGLLPNESATSVVYECRHLKL